MKTILKKPDNLFC